MLVSPSIFDILGWGLSIGFSRVTNIDEWP